MMHSSVCASLYCKGSGMTERRCVYQSEMRITWPAQLPSPLLSSRIEAA